MFVRLGTHRVSQLTVFIVLFVHTPYPFKSMERNCLFGAQKRKLKEGNAEIWGQEGRAIYKILPLVMSENGVPPQEGHNNYDALSVG
jgi:hypothetical protein